MWAGATEGGRTRQTGEGATEGGSPDQGLGGETEHRQSEPLPGQNGTRTD